MHRRKNSQRWGFFFDSSYWRISSSSDWIFSYSFLNSGSCICSFKNSSRVFNVVAPSIYCVWTGVGGSILAVTLLTVIMVAIEEQISL